VSAVPWASIEQPPRRADDFRADPVAGQQDYAGSLIHAVALYAHPFRHSFAPSSRAKAQRSHQGL
jgi:hypothetical protein